IKLGTVHPAGHVCTMSAGGGASVVYSSAIAAADFAHKLVNYNEYSGAPSEGQTFNNSYVSYHLSFPLHFTNLHLVDLTHTPPCPDGKILIISGGIADFTNIAATFKGIIHAVTSYKTRLIAHKANILIHSGDPSWQECLKAIHCLLE
ncbi:hypothetical protein BD769DRAFT_1371378, partial [Suillus cothurnatus]